jgi:uncharacterized membrane protein
MAHAIAHVLWNLFLAAVAVGLALAIPPIARRHRARRDHLLGPVLVGVVVLWLLFLPNTCYLFTELRHLFEAVDENDLWTRAHGDGGAKAQLAMRLAVAAIYTGAGALTFGAAVRPVRALAEERGVRTRLWLPFFFVVISLGVYLGLVLRFNSWDAFSDPTHVVSAAIEVASRRALLLVAGGLGLWAAYEVIDIWLDGALARWSRVWRST